MPVCHLRHRARGQTVLEFGLVAMLFITLLFGIFDFGMLFNDWISITSGASVGVRQAAVGACLEPMCATGETSVIEAVMSSPPLLAVSPAAVDVAYIDWGAAAATPTAYCRHVTLNGDGTLTIVAVTAGWSPQGVACTTGTPAPQLNNMISVQVQAQVDIPAPLLGLPSQIDLPSSSTARFEGTYVL